MSRTTLRRHHPACVSCTGLSPSVASLPRLFHYTCQIFSYWALPLSLAATQEISVDFFSCSYLDVSVLCVCPDNLFFSVASDLLRGRVPPFRYLRIIVRCRLPEAFRRLPRLSSPSTAKASTLCAFSLDHITHNPPTGKSQAFFSLSNITLYLENTLCTSALSSLPDF